jgi:hypothetical protein
MATITHPHPTSTEPTFTAAEDALWEAFADLLDTMTPENRKGLLDDLRANAEARGE